MVATVKNAKHAKVGAHSVISNLWGETTGGSTTKSKGRFFFLVYRQVTSSSLVSATSDLHHVCSPKNQGQRRRLREVTLV